MYLVPSDEQRLTIPFDQPHTFADIGMLHPDSPDQFWSVIGTGKIYLGFSITEDVHMRRLMIVREDYDSETFDAQNRDHENNLSRWVFQDSVQPLCEILHDGIPIQFVQAFVAGVGVNC